MNNDNPSKADTTHFGYKTVAANEKEQLVAGVFHSVAQKYDVMNDLMSFGVHRLWKRYALEMAQVRAGMQTLDLAGGTGDIAALFAPRVGPKGKVVCADINSSMLNVGRDKLIDQGLVGNIEYVQANAECLPFADNSFDIITMGFGLRNVTDKDQALASMCRVLKPGGRLLILEFSKPLHPALSKIYDFYSFNLLPKMGKLVANDSDSYQYLAESIRMHPDQETLKAMALNAGFDRCDVFNLTGGIVALHRAFKA